MLLSLALQNEHAKRLLNVALRGAALASKFLLTLYLGRYFSLADIGTYGLVLGIVMILNAVFGFRLDFVISRDVVNGTPATAARRIKEQAQFYLWNYAIFAAIMGGLMASNLTGIPTSILAYVLVLAVLENFGNVLTENIVALRKPLLSTFFVFLRIGLWPLPVIGLGLLNPAYRNIHLLLFLWSLGTGAAVLATLAALRDLPWREAFAVPVAWSRVRENLRTTLPIWLGGMGVVGGAYIDRFVVSHFLGMDQAGVVTFYASFSLTLVTLMQSGVFAFTYPRLIQHHERGDTHAYAHESRRTARQVFFLAGGVALFLGAVVPPLGGFLGHHDFLEQAPTFWLMLLATWFRTNADTLTYMLYARRQDRAIWLGDMISLIPSLGGNLLFVPLLGLKGIGLSAILATSFLLLWRGFHVHRGFRQPGP